jgi:apolipoprotein N-acyltransferase
MWAAVVSISRAMVLRSRHWLVTLAYPAAWAAAETIASTLSPHGTYGSMAYSQMNVLPVIQAASLAGTAGIVFLMSIPASLVSIATRRQHPGRRMLAYGFPFAILVMAIGYGALRLNAARPAGSVTFGLAAIDPPAASAQSAEDQRIAPELDRYAGIANRLAAGGAKVIVFPEALAVLGSASQTEWKQRMEAAARADDAFILTGVVTQNGSRYRNRAWVFGPDGELAASYAKHHPVPGLEARITPGTAYSTLTIDGRRFGVAICKDMDFPALARHYARLGVAALLVPAGDFRLDGWMHSRIAILRGVEDGFSVIRAANYGMMTISDPYGRVIGQARSRSDPGAVMLASAAIGPPLPTPYTRFGYLFGWLCVALLALAGARIALAENRSRLEARWERRFANGNESRVHTAPR